MDLGVTGSNPVASTRGANSKSPPDLIVQSRRAGEARSTKQIRNPKRENDRKWMSLGILDIPRFGDSNFLDISSFDIRICFTCGFPSNFDIRYSDLLHVNPVASTRGANSKSPPDLIVQSRLGRRSTKSEGSTNIEGLNVPNNIGAG